MLMSAQQCSLQGAWRCCSVAIPSPASAFTHVCHPHMTLQTRPLPFQGHISALSSQRNRQQTVSLPTCLLHLLTRPLHTRNFSEQLLRIYMWSC